MSRITPLSPPYPAQVAASLQRWMPPDVAHEPLVLFRILHRHPELAARMRVLGAGLLAHGELPAVDREVVIARTCARCGCGYEWGVHAAVFAEAVGLSPEQLHATVLGAADAEVWSAKHQSLIRVVDELHETASVPEPTWASLQEHYNPRQLLELIVLAGWYRTIAYLANGLLLDNEPWSAPVPAHER